MEITVRLTDILMILIAACACVATVYAVLLMRRMERTLSDWQRTAARAEEMFPKVERLCATSEEAMGALKTLAERGGRAMADVADVTGQVKEAAQEGLAQIHGLLGALRSASVIAEGFAAGLSAVRRCADDTGERETSQGGTDKERDDEERDH